MAFHVFLKEGRIEEALWTYHSVCSSESDLKDFLLEQDTGRVSPNNVLIINGDNVPLVKKECLVIKEKE